MTKKRRRRFNAQPISDALLAKLPDMDARDAMRGEHLFAKCVTSGTWDEEEASSSSEAEDTSPFVQRGSLNKRRFFGDQNINYLPTGVMRRTVRLTSRSRKNGSST
eukprot:422732-Amphidinium_carterae.1